MTVLAQLVQRVSKITKVKCRPASEDDLEVLRDLDFPEIIVEFFAKYEPERAMEYGPSIGTINAIEVMCNGVVYEAGLMPFGDTMNGDTLCFDPDIVDNDGWPAIVRVDHELVGEESHEGQVLEATKPYCASLPALLEIMIANANRKRA